MLIQNVKHLLMLYKSSAYIFIREKTEKAVNLEDFIVFII